MRFDAETLEFLQQPLLMRLGTLGSDGFPQVTPVWYIYEQERFFTSTQKARIKYRNILHDPHVGASIDWDRRPYRGLSIRGMARFVEDDIAPIIQRICTRYVPPEELDDMVNWVMRGQRVIIEIDPINIAKVGAGWA